MKRSLTYLFGGCALLFTALTSCKKDEVRAVAQPGAAPVLTSSVASSTATPITLLQTQSDNNAVTYKWTATSFGYPAVISYTLQFDKKGGDFSSPVSFGAGSDLTKTLTVSDLNSVYQAKGLVSATTAPAPTPVDVRVLASVGDGPVVTSAVSTVTATPYAFCAQPDKTKAWTMIGTVGFGTDWSTDYSMVYSCSANTFTFTGPLKAGDFKFRYSANWDINVGGPSTGGALVQDGPNINIPRAGNYIIVLSPTSNAVKNASGSYTIRTY